MAATISTPTTSAIVYSIRDEFGRILASGEYAPYVDDAAYNKACVLNPDGYSTIFTYFVNGEPHYTERKVCFKNNIRAGYPHHYEDIIRDDRCVVDYCYYNHTAPHTIFDDEGEAMDYILQCILDSYNAMQEDDETFGAYVEREICYWSITPLKEWRENARVARFGARSVIR